MRNFLRGAFFFASGAVALLCVLEMAFRLLPATSGLQQTSDSSAWPLHSYEAHRPYQYSYTWAMLNSHHGMTNNYGHIAPFEFRAGSHPMIVIGDSYVESLMNEYDDTIQGVLGRHFGSRDAVYGLGVSGLSASDYIVLARQARDEFRPSAVIILISDGDMTESLQRRPGGYHLERRNGDYVLEYSPLSPSPIMDWTRDKWGSLALYDYMRGNLKFSPGNILADMRWGHVKPAPKQAPTGEAQQVLDWFLKELPVATGVSPGCTFLLVDSDRYGLYESRPETDSKEPRGFRQLVVSRGRAAGFTAIDLGQVFAAEYARIGLKLDYWPVDRHWNRYGHGAAASAVMAALSTRKPGMSCMPPAARFESNAVSQ